MRNNTGQSTVVCKKLYKQIHDQTAKHIQKQLQVSCSCKILGVQQHILDGKDGKTGTANKQDQRPKPRTAVIQFDGQAFDQII